MKPDPVAAARFNRPFNLFIKTKEERRWDHNHLKCFSQPSWYWAPSSVISIFPDDLASKLLTLSSHLTLILKKYCPPETMTDATFERFSFSTASINQKHCLFVAQQSERIKNMAKYLQPITLACYFQTFQAFIYETYDILLWWEYKDTARWCKAIKWLPHVAFLWGNTVRLFERLPVLHELY